MPTITLTPTACTSASGWKDLRYYRNSSGLTQLIFTYAANAELGGAGVNVTQIVVHGYARNASSVAKKLRFGFRPSASSGVSDWATYNSESVLDSAFQAAGASNGSTTKNFKIARTYSASSLSDAFTLFAGHLKAQFAAGSAVYLGVIQPVSGYSIQVNPDLSYWAIDVTYELLGNIPTNNVTTAKLGSTAITTTVNRVLPGSTTTLKYKIGDTTVSTVSLGTGTSNTYTPPTSLGSYFPSALSAVLTIEAETFWDGTSYGTVSSSVTLTLPDDAAPTCTVSASRTWASGVASAAQIGAYVQSKSGVMFTLTGAGRYGASVSAYRMTFDSRSASGSGGSFAFSPIYSSGTVSYTYIQVPTFIF